jgi:folate-binding protein YgfZ
LLDISAGVAQVYAATSEEFVAQMLNLDALGGISFEKGCYTGQEVIARAHYRGRVKRRMQRFLSREPVTGLAPGVSGQLADGRTFKVVEAAELANGRCEFLAVAPMVTGGAGEAAGGAGDGAGAAAGGGRGAAGGEAVATAPVAAGGGRGAAGGEAVATAPVAAGGGRGAADAEGGSSTTSAPVVDAEALPMSYPLPD